jgi:LuxR family transcriptional regulator, maltose regulon positive regulatory protein
LLALLNPAIPAVFIEGGAGTHKSALLTDWVQAPAAELRVLVEFDQRQLTPAAVIQQLAYRLALAGVAVPELTSPSSWDALVDQIEVALDEFGGPLTLGVVRMDELPIAASKMLIEATGSMPGFRLVASAVDAQRLVTEAGAAGIGHLVIGDDDLTYDFAEVAEFLTAELPGAGDSTVRAVLDATHGNPALVERVVSLFPQECLAGTVDAEQALGGWMPERVGAREFRAQLRELSQAPRFNLELLTCMYGAERGEYLFARFPKLGVGTMSEPISGGRIFTWMPAVRRYVIQVWHADESIEQFHADRARLAECAQLSHDAELALAMLVANRDLDEAEKLCAQWLWELTDADADLVAEHFSAIDPQSFTTRPSLLAAATLLLPGRGAPSDDPELAAVQQSMLATTIGGGIREQLSTLAKAATVALGIGELGVGVRAAVRWASLILTKPESWKAQVDPELVSDGLSVVRALVQLDRIDLVSPVAAALLSALRRLPDQVGGIRSSRVSSLHTSVRMASTLLGLSRAETRSVQLAPRQYNQDFDLVMHAVIDACEALDRGDLVSAEAFTRVAMLRVASPLEWSVLIFLRAISLLALGDRDNLEVLDDQLQVSSRWQAWQYHLEAPGLFAYGLEILTAITLRRGPRSLVELLAHVKALLPGAKHRWPAWGQRLLETAILAGSGALRGLGVPTDTELEPFPPRMAWQLVLLVALVSLRAGEGATAVSVMLRGARDLRYPNAPIALVVATGEEIRDLNDWLPAKTPPVIRTSLAFAQSYVGVPVDTSHALQLGARELEVLDGVRRGLTNSAIARELFVSVNTIKFHRANLYRKLKATSREELLAEALQQGL